MLFYLDNRPTFNKPKTSKINVASFTNLDPMYLIILNTKNTNTLNQKKKKH